MTLTFFPRRTLVVRSVLSPDEVLRRLAERVEPKRLLRFGGDRPYEGVVSPQGFEIRRIILYRNSFLPHVHGSVRPDGPGSVVQAELALHPFTAVFMGIWLGLVGLFGVVFVVTTVAHGGFDASMLIPLGMFGAGYGMMHGGFAFEVGKVRRLLDEISRP